ncbi:tetratricopeptide repeat protein 36 isoform X2 [Bacillus rossius redtenbacheri]|uniref:tetratricopeptide repeat protein 36 isoform X2 n=1 Tax=Bacillus rossius redtenbacheri TaxID=93214 RepID=UPI002FDE6A9D
MASEHDRAVLNCIFNPLLPIGENAYDEDLPADLTDDEPQTLESKQAKQLELEGVKAAESGDVAMAVGIFTRAINTCPTLPSCYNNRAQAYRIQDNIEGTGSRVWCRPPSWIVTSRRPSWMVVTGQVDLDPGGHIGSAISKSSAPLRHGT